MKCSEAFEKELQSRGLVFTRVEPTGRYRITVGETDVEVSLENLERQFSRNNDLSVITAFVDAIVSTGQGERSEISQERLFWMLEPNDYQTPPPFRHPISKQVDRVLVHIEPEGKAVTWITGDMLIQLGLSAEKAAAIALDNLAMELERVSVEELDVGKVTLVTFGTDLPCKTALLLAPNLMTTLDKIMEIPVMAVAPDRDFLYLWPAKHTDFAGKLGGVVSREFAEAPYPLSTEVFKITEQGIEAVGAFAKPQGR